MLIGLDFDNTLANYDTAFLEAARARGLAAAEFTGLKTEVRDHIRQSPAGDEGWQALQGYVYGAGIGGAMLFDGVTAFMRTARQRKARIVIVSHKTEFGHFDPQRVNLRTAALDWMRRHGFFDRGGFGIAQSDVFFTGTFEEKIATIAALKPDCFVDDLPDVLAALPAAINRILFGRSDSQIASVAAAPDWRRVTELVFP